MEGERQGRLLGSGKKRKGGVVWEKYGGIKGIRNDL